jgi:hypothetical protein
MNENLLAVFGVWSAVVNTIGLFPYVRDILKHKTKPERATWWIWLLLNVIALFAQLAAGATWSTLMTVATILSVGLIAVLSVKYGYGTFAKKDFVALIIASMGALISFFIKSPLLALLVVISVDFMGYWLTFTKSWKAPHTETLSAWIFALMSAFFGAVAVGKWDFVELLYPTYFLIGNTALVLVIYTRRKVVHE